MATSHHIALLCNEQGVVERVLHDSGMLNEHCVGSSLVELVDVLSAEKAGKLLDAVRKDGIVFDWHLNMPLKNQSVQFQVSAIRYDQRILVTATQPRAAAGAFFDQMTRINSEQFTVFRKELVERSLQQLRDQANLAQLEDVVQLNNEMANLKRELAQKNAQLARADEQLAQMRAAAENAP